MLSGVGGLNTDECWLA